MNELYDEYKEEGLVVVGVCTSKNGQENFASTVESTGMKYPVARDPELKTMSEAGWVVKWFPTYVIVDKKGIVRASGLLNNEGIEEIIKKLLDEEVEEGEGDDDIGAMAGAVEIPAELLEGRDDRESIQSMAGKPAPDLVVANWMNVDPELMDVEDGFQWSDLAGKVVMLDYWATW